MTDDRTANLDLPLPHTDNDLDVDVGRMRSALTAVDAAVAAKEAAITADSTAKYWRGDKSWRDFATDVRAAVLTGIDLATSAAVTASDSVMSAIGKLYATLAGHVSNSSNPHGTTKDQVGLGNVENKSSATIRGEITSGNVTSALGFTPENAASKGVANGYAPLNASNQIPAVHLPSFVDDVLEYATQSAFPGPGASGVIYVALDTGKIYRWSGSAYVEISPSPGSTDAVTEGASNLYFTAARVRATDLTGLSTASSADVTAADSLLVAAGKLQAQITSARILVVAYDSRATLRSGTYTENQLALVDGLGLFRFVVGSDEPDDDESCFANGSDRWLLQAAHWDLVDAWMAPMIDLIT